MQADKNGKSLIPPLWEVCMGTLIKCRICNSVNSVLIQFAPWNQLDTEKAGVDQVTRAKYVKIYACTHTPQTHRHTSAHTHL